MSDWLALFAEQLSLSDFLDFRLFHDALKTLQTDFFDELSKKLIVFSQLKEGLIVVWSSDFGAFFEYFSSLLKQFS